MNKFGESQNRVNHSPSVKQKIIFITLFCFSIVLMGGYISYLLGYENFLLDEIEIDNLAIRYIANLVMFEICMCFLICIFANVYGKSLLKYTLIGALIIEPIIFFISDSTISSFVFPLIYPLIIGIINHRALKTIKNILLFFPIILIYQFLSINIKISVFELGYNDVSTYQVFMHSIDHYIFYFILCVMKGGKFNASWKRVFHSQNIETPQHDHEDRQSLEEFHLLTKWKKIKAVALLSAFQLFQLFLILLVCILGNVIIECLIIVFSYLMYTIVIRRRYHSNNLIACTSLTVLIFYISARSSAPHSVSMFAPILIGLLITYSLYLTAVHIENYDHKIKSLLNEDGLTKENLYEICKKANLSKRDTLYAKMIYIDKLSAKEISDRLNVIEATVYNKKSKLKKLIGIR